MSDYTCTYVSFLKVIVLFLLQLLTSLGFVYHQLMHISSEQILHKHFVIFEGVSIGT